MGSIAEVEVAQHIEISDAKNGPAIGFLARSAAFEQLGDPGDWNGGWTEIAVPMPGRAPLPVWFDGDQRSTVGALLRGTPTLVTGTLALQKTELHLRCETALLGKRETWVPRDAVVFIGRFTPDPGAAPCEGTPAWTAPPGTVVLPSIASREALLEQTFALGKTVYAPGADGDCHALGVVESEGRATYTGLAVARDAPVSVGGVPTPARHRWSFSVHGTTLIRDSLLVVSLGGESVCCAAGPPPENFEVVGPGPAGGVRIADLGHAAGELAVAPTDLPTTVIANSLAACAADTAAIPWPLPGESAMPILVAPRR